MQPPYTVVLGLFARVGTLGPLLIDETFMHLPWRSRSGFSLIEQVVAIASVAVTAAVVVPTVVNQLDKGEMGRIESDLRNVEKAVKDFRSDVSYWPGEIVQLRDPLKGTPSDAYGNAITPMVFPLWKGPYFDVKAFTDLGGGTRALGSAAGTYFGNELEVISLLLEGSEQDDLFIQITLNNVDEEDAAKLSERFDGDEDLTEGRLQWFPDEDGNRGQLIYYAGPVN